MKNNTELLSIRSDAKTIKGEKNGYITAVLYFRPNTQGGDWNLCPFASDGCIFGCLETSGRMNMNPAIMARQYRTELFMKDRPAFMRKLIFEIARLKRKAEKLGLIPAVRLDGTADVKWESIPVMDGVHKNIMAIFPEIQFYDYTKYPYAKRPTESLPSNYHLTFSRSESNDAEVLTNLQNGRNVAVVFSTDQLPSTYTALDGSEWDVINGDASDVRFNDPKGVVVGLKAKGKARKDTSGFVVQIN